MPEESPIRVMIQIIVKTMFILIIRLDLYYLPENMIISLVRTFIYICIYKYAI